MGIEQSAILQQAGIPMGLLDERYLKSLRLWRFRPAREVTHTLSLDVRWVYSNILRVFGR